MWDQGPPRAKIPHRSGHDRWRRILPTATYSYGWPHTHGASKHASGKPHLLPEQAGETTTKRLRLSARADRPFLTACFDWKWETSPPKRGAPGFQGLQRAIRAEKFEPLRGIPVMKMGRRMSEASRASALWLQACVNRNRVSSSSRRCIRMKNRPRG